MEIILRDQESEMSINFMKNGTSASNNMNTVVKFGSTGDKQRVLSKGYSSRRKVLDDTISDITSIPFAYIHQGSQSIKKLLSEAEEILIQAISWTIDEKDPQYAESNGGIKNFNIFKNLLQECVRICKEALKRVPGSSDQMCISGFDERETVASQNLEKELLDTLREMNKKEKDVQCKDCQRTAETNTFILNEIKQIIGELKPLEIRTEDQSRVARDSNVCDQAMIEKVNELVCQTQKASNNYSQTSVEIKSMIREIKSDMRKMILSEKMKGVKELEGLQNIDMEINSLKVKNEEMMNQLGEKLAVLQSDYMLSKSKLFDRLNEVSHFDDVRNLQMDAKANDVEGLLKVNKSQVNYQFKEDKGKGQVRGLERRSVTPNKNRMSVFNTSEGKERRSGDRIVDRKRVLRPLSIDRSAIKAPRRSKSTKKTAQFVSMESPASKEIRKPPTAQKYQEDKENKYLNERSPQMGASDFFKLTSISQMDNDIKEQTSMINSQFFISGSKVSQHFGDKLTTLALKGPDSYLVIQEKNGYSLVKEGQAIKFDNKGNPKTLNPNR